MALEKMTEAKLKAHMAPPKGFDPEVHERPRLTLDRKQHWFRAVCGNGHAHLLSLPEHGADTAFECPEAGCDGQRWAVKLNDDDEVDADA